MSVRTRWVKTSTSLKQGKQAEWRGEVVSRLDREVSSKGSERTPKMGCEMSRLQLES